jgi:hypothetical protein
MSSRRGRDDNKAPQPPPPPTTTTTRSNKRENTPALVKISWLRCTGLGIILIMIVCNYYQDEFHHHHHTESSPLYWPSSTKTTSVKNKHTASWMDPYTVTYEPWGGRKTKATHEADYSWCLGEPNPKLSGFVFAKLYKTGSSSAAGVHLRVAETVGRRIHGINVSCVSHHNHPYLLNNRMKQMDRDKSFVWTMIRQPTKRVVSAYYFYRMGLLHKEKLNVDDFLNVLHYSKNIQFYLLRKDIHRPAVYESTIIRGVKPDRRPINDLIQDPNTPYYPLAKYKLSTSLREDDQTQQLNAWKLLWQNQDADRNFTSSTIIEPMIGNGDGDIMTKIIRTTVTDDNTQHDRYRSVMADWIHQSVFQTYNFVAIMERWHESMVVLQMLLNLKESDTIITMATKSSGAYSRDWLRSTPSGGQECFRIPKPPRTWTEYPVIDTYLQNDYFVQGNLDFLLYEMANKSLDDTIDMLGRARVEWNVRRHKWLSTYITKRCISETINPCSSTGKYQAEAEHNCYEKDFGCGRHCVDRVAAQLQDEAKIT